MPAASDHRSYTKNPSEREWPLAVYAESNVIENEPSDRTHLRAPSASSRFFTTMDNEAIDDLRCATTPSLVQLHDGRERLKSRFRLLRRLHANHDAEGARAPNQRSVDTAIAVIDLFSGPLPVGLATLDDDGSAVIEFEDRQTGFFADITFRDAGTIECYRRQPGAQSEFFEGELHSRPTRQFLEKIGLAIQS